jgi:mono/diheme cytochrome c family protein
MKHPKLVTAIVTVVVLLVAEVLIALAVAYSGVVDVAASKPEGAVASWFLSTTLDHSVSRHAQVISPDLARADLAEGAEHYAAMCAFCHGGPGHPPGEISRGFNPPPPDLAESGDLTAGEIYWILDNGIKMTGMPAFGKTHTPEQLTSMTAFVKKLPAMTPDEYQRLTSPAKTTTEP